MGVVCCKKHGVSGIRLTCIHLSESVWNYQPVHDFVERVDSDYAAEFNYDWVFLLCKTCDKEYKKTSIIEEFPEDLLQPVCGECFKELSNLES